jgi:hypothetical protein
VVHDATGRSIAMHQNRDRVFIGAKSIGDVSRIVFRPLVLVSARTAALIYPVDIEAVARIGKYVNQSPWGNSG